MSSRARTGIVLGMALASFAWGPPVLAAGSDPAMKAELDELKNELATQKARLDSLSTKTTEKEVVEQFNSATPTPPPASARDLESLKAEVAQLRAAQTAAEEARAMEELEKITAAAAEGEKPQLKFYGFLDGGFNKMFLQENDSMRGLYMRNGNFTFVPGSMNVYLDAKNGKGFRALLETRYTFYPSGEIASTSSGQLKPVDTRVYDQFSPSGYNKVSWGGIVIERAHIDYEVASWLTLRVGYFLTPYGIWNVDHGTPTLISIILPQFQILEVIPQRLTGVQALGEIGFAPYTLGYRLYATNGRSFQVATPSSDNGYGGRVYLRRDGETNLTLGTSFYTGTYSDKVVTMAFDPVTMGVSFNPSYTYKAREYTIGADLSLDYGNLRARAEFLARRLAFEDGKHPLTEDPTKYQPNRWETYSYVLLAYRLHRYFEPFVYAEAKYNHPNYDVDRVHAFSGGLNLYFTSTAMLKTQYAYFRFDNRTGPAVDNHNFGFLCSRFIFVF
jgi:hypothetical protein